MYVASTSNVSFHACLRFWGLSALCATSALYSLMSVNDATMSAKDSQRVRLISVTHNGYVWKLNQISPCLRLFWTECVDHKFAFFLSSVSFVIPCGYMRTLVPTCAESLLSLSLIQDTYPLRRILWEWNLAGGSHYVRCIRDTCSFTAFTGLCENMVVLLVPNSFFSIDEK
jgi:hypothetical protein